LTFFQTRISVVGLQMHLNALVMMLHSEQTLKSERRMTCMAQTRRGGYSNLRHNNCDYDEYNYNGDPEVRITDRFSEGGFRNQNVPKSKECRFLRVVSGTLKSVFRELL
jgi:hypothetical protein